MSDPTAPPPSSYDPPSQPPSYDPPAPPQPPSYDPPPQPPSYDPHPHASPHPHPHPPSYDPSPQPPSYDPGPSYQQPGGDPFGAPPVSGYPGAQQYGPPPGQPGYPAGQPGYQPGQPGYPPAPVKGKSNVGVIIAVVAAVVVLLCGGVAVAGFLAFKRTADAVGNALPSVAPTLPDLPTDVPSDGPGLPGPAGSQPAGEVPVVYEVTGDGPARLTWFDGNLGPKRAESQKLPWRMEVKLPHGRLPATVIAVRDGTGEGSITCRVLINGKETVKQQKSGPFAFVNCSDFNEK